ncbi:MAG: hypothetical protein AMXMBFR47_41130 [Planctomycetota bacterium]
MNSPRWVPPLFWLAAFYDGVLGLLFLVAPLSVFQFINVAPPNHVAYVQFPAALLLIFALMFLHIAHGPATTRTLILYGILLKVAYCGVAGGHWIASGIPGVWKVFVLIDAAMAALFAWAYAALPRSEPAPTSLE